VLVIAFCVAGSLALLFGVPKWRTERQKKACIENLRQLWSAACSFSLEKGIGGWETVKPEDSTGYLKDGKVPWCPLGGEPYAPFVIYQGPSCPNGHPGWGQPLPAWSGSSSAYLDALKKDLAAHGKWIGSPVLMQLTPELFNDPKVREFILDGVENWTNGDDVCAAEVLGRIRDQRAVPWLVDKLSNKNAPPLSRAKAAEVLGRIGDTRATEALQTAANDDNKQVRKAATQALWAPGKTPVRER
jgi:hypothetical protein